MSLRRDESADHVIRTSIGWYEAGALSLTANSKKICPPQWYRLAAAVLLQHAVILFILLPNAHLLTIGYRPEFTTVMYFSRAVAAGLCVFAGYRSVFLKNDLRSRQCCLQSDHW
jgi:hypothetical protein